MNIWQFLSKRNPRYCCSNSLSSTHHCFTSIECHLHMKPDIERLMRGGGSTSLVAQFLQEMRDPGSEQRNPREIPWSLEEKNTGVEKSIWTWLWSPKPKKKWIRKKWPKSLLPHPCSIFDIADLEYVNSANFIRSSWISAFQSCQKFWNRSTGAKTVLVFVRTVGFGVAIPPSHDYPDNRLHIHNSLKRPLRLIL